MAIKNKALRSLAKVSSRAIVITPALKLNELQRLVAGLYYVSAALRPFVGRRFASAVGLVPALLVGVTGSTVVESDSLQWLTPGKLAFNPPAVLVAQHAVLRYRALASFLEGQLQNFVAYLLGDGATKRIAFCGRWREGGDWIVLQAEFVV